MVIEVEQTLRKSSQIIFVRDHIAFLASEGYFHKRKHHFAVDVKSLHESCQNPKTNGQSETGIPLFFIFNTSGRGAKL